MTGYSEIVSGFAIVGDYTLTEPERGSATVKYFVPRDQWQSIAAATADAEEFVDAVWSSVASEDRSNEPPMVDAVPGDCFAQLQEDLARAESNYAIDLSHCLFKQREREALAEQAKRDCEANKANELAGAGVGVGAALAAGGAAAKAGAKKGAITGSCLKPGLGTAVGTALGAAIFGVSGWLIADTIDEESCDYKYRNAIRASNEQATRCAELAQSVRDIRERQARERFARCEARRDFGVE
jgi:hypothetical protein